MENKIVTEGVSFKSSWIHQLYQRDANLVEMTTKNGRTYYVRGEFSAQIDEWFATSSKGRWFLRNKDRLTIVRDS